MGDAVNIHCPALTPEQISDAALVALLIEYGTDLARSARILDETKAAQRGWMNRSAQENFQRDFDDARDNRDWGNR